MTITSATSGPYAIPTAQSALPVQKSTAALYLAADAGSNSDTVTLSDAASAYLENKASGSTTTSQAGNFVLTPSQQKLLTSIVAKYSGAPLTQDTFNALQSDLQAVGLSPDELSAQDRTNAFNPELEFLNASNGIASNLPSPAAEDTKKNNYVNQLYTLLQTASAATTTNAASS